MGEFLKRESGKRREERKESGRVGRIKGDGGKSNGTICR
jgi:hypothetical protein